MTRVQPPLTVSQVVVGSYVSDALHVIVPVSLPPFGGWLGSRREPPTLHERSRMVVDGMSMRIGGPEI